MSAPNCVRCGRPTPDGYADVVCGVEQPRAWFAEIADMAPAARDVAQRQARRGTGGGASGKPGSSLPIDLAPTARLVGTLNALRGWSRQIASERGILAALYLPYEDPLSTVSGWLSDHVEWIRHLGPATKPQWTALYATLPDSTALDLDVPPLIAAQFIHAVEKAARVVRGIARGPAAQRYLGPCGADLNAEFAEGLAGEPRCEGDVYGPQGGKVGTCRTCGAQVAQDERKAWLDEQVRDKAFRAAHIADAYRINVNTIRSWALRGLLIQRGIDRQLRPVYLVGDVLDLAREAAARRAENEAKKARREAAEMGA